ncbi:MAG: EpsI family protein [Acidobacteria bacterium]|nr:EpsI family protein [Acidobacteriota bacterium]
MIGRATVLFACFVAATGVIARASHIEPVPIRTSFDQFPMQIGEWRGTMLPPLSASIMSVLRVDDYVNRVYSAPGRYGAGFYVGYYRSQRQGDSIHSPLNCMPGAGWEPVSKGALSIAVPGAGRDNTIAVNRFVIEKGPDRQLVLYWYQSHGRVVADEYWSKFYLIRDAVRLNRTDAALVRVIVPIPSNLNDAESHAEEQAAAFVRSMFPLLSTYLPSCGPCT